MLKSPGSEAVALRRPVAASMLRRRAALLVLLGAALLSVEAMAAIPHQGLHLPLAPVLAALLPLQLAALFYVCLLYTSDAADDRRGV